MKGAVTKVGMGLAAGVVLAVSVSSCVVVPGGRPPRRQVVVTPKPHPHPKPKVIVTPKPKRPVVVVKRPPMPKKPPRVVKPRKPHPHAVWVSGSWRWDGKKWVWRKGHWKVTKGKKIKKPIKIHK